MGGGIKGRACCPVSLRNMVGALQLVGLSHLQNLTVVEDSKHLFPQRRVSNSLVSRAFGLSPSFEGGAILGPVPFLLMTLAYV
jgi:hypothetical protein